MEYKTIIDKYIDSIKEEYTSAHEKTTKAFNYEYFCGKLYGVYEIAEAYLDAADFTELYDYRRDERGDLSMKFNQEYINPIYSTIRRES